MSNKRVTNNSVASLDEQSELLSDVFNKADSENLAKMSDKERKKLLRRKKELEFWLRHWKMQKKQKVLTGLLY